MTKARRFVWWILGRLVIGAVGGAISLRIGFAWYLGSENFHRRISLATSRFLRAEGEFMPLHFSGATVYSDGFAARGTEGAFFSTLRADQIRAQFNWHGLLHRVWQIDELSAQRAEIHFADRKQPLVRPKGETKLSSPSGFRLDLRRANIAESVWFWNGGGITKSSLTLTPSGLSWLIDATGGQLNQTGWPSLEIESAKFRYTHDALFLTESTLRDVTGRVLVTGEVRFERSAEFQAEFDKLAVGPLLPADWRARLSGNFSGTAKIHLPLSDPRAMQINGSLTLSDGQLEALPILNQIASFTGSERFRRMALRRASLDFNRSDGAITASSVVLESEGLMRMEGAFTIRDEQIDGNFQLGVTPASLQWLPGSRERVFTTSRDGYFWTPMHVTGPVAHPAEDLSGRLIAAAAGQLLDEPTKAARDAAKALLDLLPH